MRDAAPDPDDLHTLAARLAERCLATGRRVVTAESCTGGLVGHTCTEIAGLQHLVPGRGHRLCQRGQGGRPGRAGGDARGPWRRERPDGRRHGGGRPAAAGRGSRGRGDRHRGPGRRHRHQACRADVCRGRGRRRPRCAPLRLAVRPERRTSAPARLRPSSCCSTGWASRRDAHRRRRSAPDCCPRGRRGRSGLGSASTSSARPVPARPRRSCSRMRPVPRSTGCDPGGASPYTRGARGGRHPAGLGARGGRTWLAGWRCGRRSAGGHQGAHVGRARPSGARRGARRRACPPSRGSRSSRMPRRPRAGGSWRSPARTASPPRTGWLVHVLVAAGADPAAFVGALLPAAVTGGLPGDGALGEGWRVRGGGGRVRRQLRRRTGRTWRCC